MYDKKTLFYLHGIDPNGFKLIINNATAIPDNFKNTFLAYFLQEGLNEIILSDTITTIGDSAFNDFYVGKLTLGSSVKIIGESAFNNNQIQTLSLPNGLTTISDYVSSSNNISNVTIPSSVISMSCMAFDDAVNITYQNTSFKCFN